MIAEMLQKTDPKRLEEGSAEMRKALEYYGSHTWVLGAEVADYLLHPAHLHPFPLKAVFDLPMRQDPSDCGFVIEDYHTSTRPVIVSPALALRLVQHSAELASRYEGLARELEMRRREITELQEHVAALGWTISSMKEDAGVLRAMLSTLLNLPKVRKIAGRAGFMRKFRIFNVDGVWHSNHGGKYRGTL